MKVELNDKQRAELKRLSRLHGASGELATRARIVLAIAAGESTRALAARLGIAEATARMWRRRYEAKGLAGLRGDSVEGPARAARAARTDAPRAPRVSRSSIDKSRRILHEAMNLFLKKGYGSVSINEILSRVGGSKTTIYARFRDKASLFEAVIDGLLNEIVEFKTALDFAHLGIREALMHIARQHIETAMSDRYVRLIRIVAAEVHQFPELGRLFYEHGPGRSYENFAEYLRQQNKAATVRIPDVRLATDFFFGGLLHRRVLARIYGVEDEPSSSDAAAIARTVVSEFLAAYATGKSDRR